MSVHSNVAEGIQIPGKVEAGVIPRFRVERQRIPDEHDPETGLPKYRTVELVDLLIPGDKNNTPTKRVTPEIKQRFAREYALWKAQGQASDAQLGDGLPLNQWPQIPKELAAGLAHANVFTVQQLANLSDTQCQIRGTIGLRKYRDMAAAFISASAAAAPIAELTKKNEALENQMALMKRQMEQMQENFEKELQKAQQARENEMPDLSEPPTQRNKGR
ncbi:MAG: hypothetical protein E6Q97_15465 [Desulfurellales bacterium]|nr:MAG: hypothetical protein E6Q97_15465 [Desulfurellales bacterium]